MTFMAQTLVDAISIGSIYALSALGIGLIFGILRLVNFAHGEFITLGIYVLMLTASQWFPIAAVLTLAVVVGLALLTERFAFRPVRQADSSTLLITSFALSYLLQNILVLVFGARPVGVDILPGLSQPLMLGEVRIPIIHLVTIGVTALLLAAVALFLRGTRIGVETRAAAVDFEMARLLGIRGNRVIAAAFAVSGMLAAAVAVLYVAQTGVAGPAVGLKLALVGFVATVIGGMGSLPGAVLGGMAVGMVTVLLQTLLPPDLRPFREAFVFLVVIAILVMRPQGLFRSNLSKERV